MGKSSALLNLAVSLFPVALLASILIVAAVGLYPSAVLAGVASAGGVVLLIAAKLPAIRARRWISFGPRGLSSRGRYAYFAAWGLIVVAALLWIGILPLVRV